MQTFISLFLCAITVIPDPVGEYTLRKFLNFQNQVSAYYTKTSVLVINYDN